MLFIHVPPHEQTMLIEQDTDVHSLSTAKSKRDITAVIQLPRRSLVPDSTPIFTHF